MQTVNAELVADRGRWFREIPPEAAFDVDAAMRAVDAAVSDVGRELRARRQRASSRARNAARDLAVIAGRLGELRALSVKMISPAIAARVRGDIVRAGDALFQDLERRPQNGCGEVAVREPRRMGGDDSLLGAAVIAGGIWLLDRALGGGRRRY